MTCRTPAFSSFPRSAWERTVLTLCVTLLLSLASGASANDPQINSLAPYGVQRATEAKLTLTGTGMATVQEILFYTPGFTVKSLEAPKDDTLNAVIVVAPECELGIHAIRLRSSGGV